MEATSGEKWGAAIRALLQEHGLTLRGAAQKVGRPALRTYLADWIAGQIPQYRTAIDFLEHFPREEATACLEAADYPIPREWQQELDPVVAVKRSLRVSRPDLPADAIQQIEDFVKEVLEEHGQLET
jgi:hypothetical protein